ncbi:MAG: 2,3-bisphosphoglycerate-independent phosphoglycerate mutase [Actinobacteria bacterium]|nr:2,3-bisphosphoglycerate-independent phosphoglycerate mutase [Actinomycetota bacterium]
MGQLFRKIPKPLVLTILDGWGVGDGGSGDVIAQSSLKNMTRFLNEYPSTRIKSSEEAVGLPIGQMGNSEVGHLNMGAGRIVYQDLTRITKSIKDGDFFKNGALLAAVENVNSNSSALHLMGLLSDGGVHSHIEHLYALIRMAKMHDIDRIHVHAFLDGRDVPPDSGIYYVINLEEFLSSAGLGEPCTICGRYYAMDRDNRWDRVEKAYDAIVYGEGIIETDPAEAVRKSYKAGVMDEFMVPTVINKRGRKYDGVRSGDSVIFFNFRADRARELTRSFFEKGFDKFDRGPNPPSVFFVCMTEYDADFGLPIAFPTLYLKNTLADVISDNGLKQLHIAETEKYAHVTFFLNGGVEEPKAGEDRILIPSPKVSTYDLKPEMSAYEVKDRLLSEIQSSKYDVIVVNFANADMVGHTGVIEAIQKAVRTVDECIGQIAEKVNEVGGLMIITADHGNADDKLDLKTNETITAHSLNPVPFIVLTNERMRLRDDGILADVAPTVLDIMGIGKPDEMTGRSLIVY